MSPYLAVLILAVVIPLAFSFYPPLRFYRHKRALAASLGLVALVFGGWDILAVARGHWHFDPRGVSGRYFLSLPVEEWFFFIAIPFCCIFSWEVVLYYWKKRQ